MNKVTLDPPLLEDAPARPPSRVRSGCQSRPDLICNLFTIRPNVDTQSLLCHASETLASMNVMATDLACELQGSRRSVAMALQQLTELGELLVNRALENLEPPVGLPATSLSTTTPNP